MSEEETEVQETTTNELSTQVGDFRKVQAIDDGSSWTVDIATSIFYQFIIPTTKPLALQSNIQDGLTAWLASKGEWTPEIVGEAIKFNADTFRQINKEALDKLLSAQLLELQEQPEKFTNATYKVVDEQGNETGEQKKIPYGYNLQNPKGFSVADDVESDIQQGKSYKEWMKLINDAKVEITALKVEKKKAKDEMRETIDTKINDMVESIEDAEWIIEQMKSFSYNDSVTLKEVVQNTKDAQRFYLRMSFDPDDPKVAVALGNLIGEEFGTWEENQQLFESTFGIAWGTYKEQLKEQQQKYYNQLGLSNKIKTALSKSEENLELSVDEFVEGFGNDFPITVTEYKTNEEGEKGEAYNAELDTKEELMEWVNTNDMETIETTLDKLVSKTVRQLNQFSKGRGTQITLTEPRKPKEDAAGKRTEFYDKPLRMSKEDISEYVISDVRTSDNKRKDLVSADNIKVPKKLSDQRKSNIKIKIDIPKSTMLDGFKGMYARLVGGESEELVGVKKDPIRTTARAKGTINIKETKATNKAQEFIPYFAALSEYKEIRKALTSFLRRKKTTEEAEESKKKWISEGNYRKLAEYLHHLWELQEIQEDTSNFNLDIEPIDLSYWLKPDGKMKETYKNFVNKIAGYAAGGKGQKTLLKELKLLSDTFKKLDEIKEDFLDALEEAEEALEDFTPNENEMDTLTEEEIEALSPRQRKEYYDTLRELQEKRSEKGSKDTELSEGKQTAEQESDELDSEESMQQALQQAIEGTIDIDFESGELIDLENDLDEIENSELIDYLTEMDGDDLTDIATLIFDLHDDLEDFVKYKNMNINSANFKKMLSKFGKMTKMDTGMAKLIEDIEGGVFTQQETGELDEEGNPIMESVEQKTEESAKIIENTRTQIENFWDEAKTTFQEPAQEDFIRLVNVIDLKEVIANAMHDDLGFNDARHAIVEIESKALEIVIDLKGNEVKLTGKIAWTSKGTHYIDYKEKGGYIPKYWPQKQYSEVPKTKVGAAVDYTGKEQVVQAKPIDKMRLRYFKEIRTRTQLLMGAVR